jgi:hypothetical protein
MVITMRIPIFPKVPESVNVYGLSLAHEVGLRDSLTCCVDIVTATNGRQHLIYCTF